MSDVAWIALNSVNGLGPVRIKHLIDRYGSAEEVFKLRGGELRAGGLIPDQCIARLTEAGLFTEAEAQIALARNNGASIFTLASPDYPPYLKEIFAPPPVLFLRGDASVFSRHAVAIVGTRNATAYGKAVTRSITGELVEHGLVIVSGLARGIDTVAHRSCVDKGGSTVAVLGCGIDRIYPADNAELGEEICAKGALISEFPMGTAPEPFNFPRRNRIIAGLSAGVLVVEGGEKSGGLITASYALQQGRDVFAVPGPITSPQSVGTFNLLRDGAIPARSGHEMADVLSLIGNSQLKSRASVGVLVSAPVSLLTEAERAIYDTLSETPRRMDELSTLTGKTIMQLFDVLLNLELKGLAQQLGGQCYVRA